MCKYKNKKDYEVGYGKPPKETRFKKGQSGNPAGRKKKPELKSLFDALCVQLTNMHLITNEWGQKEKMAVYEILAKQMACDAMKKDGPSRKFILDNMFKLDVLLQRRFLEEKEEYKPETLEERKRRIEIMEKLCSMIKEDEDDD